MNVYEYYFLLNIELNVWKEQNELIKNCVFTFQLSLIYIFLLFKLVYF